MNKDVHIAEYHEHGPELNFDDPWSEPYRAIGSIVVCSCGRYVRHSLMSGSWSPVRWWQFRARRRINQWKRTNTSVTGAADK